MITRLSKIARLPAHIREQLNRHLHDGKLSNHILPWVNSLPETQAVLTELFHGKPITHQNLSEWRRAGYQDWLFHQQRLQWFNQLTEQSREIQKHDGCPDTYETMANIFLFEIGQALTVMKATKDPNQRCDRLQNLIREFARLQNAYNWSRRVELDFAKHNATLEPVNPNSSRRPPTEVLTKAGEDAQTSSFCIPPSTLPPAGGASVPASRAQLETYAGEPAETAAEPSPGAPASRQPELEISKSDDHPNASSPTSSFCILPSAFPESSPLPLSENNSLTPKLLNSSTPLTRQPIPPLAPTPTPPTRNLKGVHVPMRGRRFVCIEG